MLVIAHAGEHAETLVATAPAIAGLVAGAAHVVMGPDHMAAVAPLAIDSRPKRGWIAGCLWGLGHSGGVWTLALLALVLREALPLGPISAWSERLVGLVLIAMGLWGIRRVTRLHVHTHRHTHVGADGVTHTHDHTHVHARASKSEHAAHPHDHRHSLLGIGALHGFAGTAHLVGVLPALAMPDRTTAVLYVVAFGIGSIIGMGVFTAALGALVRATDALGSFATRALLSLSSIAAIGIGAFWLANTA